MDFDLSPKKLVFGSVLLSSFLSCDAKSEVFYSNDFSYCGRGIPQVECDYMYEKRSERAFNYFKAFVVYKAAEYVLDETGYLPAANEIIGFARELSTFDSPYGTYFFNGKSLMVKDFMNVKNSYLELKLGFDSNLSVDKFKVQYSVRF
jgi:hypothetical protein